MLNTTLQIIYMAVLAIHLILLLNLQNEKLHDFTQTTPNSLSNESDHKPLLCLSEQIRRALDRLDL